MNIPSKGPPSFEKATLKNLFAAKPVLYCNNLPVAVFRKDLFVFNTLQNSVPSASSALHFINITAIFNIFNLHR